MPIAGVPAALAIGRAASAGSRIALLRRSIRRDVVRRFVPAVLPGVWLRSRLEPACIEFIAGGFLRANLPAPFRRRARAAQPPLSSRALPLIGEGAFRRVGHGAMVAAGAATFLPPGDQIARRHRAWVMRVALGREHEVQRCWRGARLFALEWEPGGCLVVERPIAWDALPGEARRATLARIVRAAITLIGQVRGARSRCFAVYNRLPDGREAKIEVADG